MSNPLLLSALASQPSATAINEVINTVGTASAGISTLRALLEKVRKTQPQQAVMPRRRGPQRKRRSRRRPKTLGYMRPTRLTVRLCIPWSETKGSDARWYTNITLKQLVERYTTVYDEFRVVRLDIQHKPANAASAVGLYAGVLMDQKGFGSFGTATAPSWFKTLASMPGSKVCNPHMGMRFSWRPTEPDSRQWRSFQQGETDYTVCTIYFADNGDQATELGGALIVYATVLGRGMYYNAKVITQLRQSGGEMDWYHVSHN